LHVSELPILVTGVGKVCAASALSAVLARQRPLRIINLGTAGALREGLSGTQVAGRVVQHDFDDEGIFGLTGEHFGAPIDLGADGPVLGSGDVFVNGGAARASLLARVCSIWPAGAWLGPPNHMAPNPASGRPVCLTCS
jgi:adenosylhomocysteine nucleosidase